jgi:molecular chaperone DnaJ
MKKINANGNKINFNIINLFYKNSNKNFHGLFNTNTITLLKNNNPQNFNINININISNYKFKSINKIQFKNFSQKNLKLDPYLILEVNRGADFKTIKTAYFKLARVYHPDANQNDEVKK